MTAPTGQGVDPNGNTWMLVIAVGTFFFNILVVAVGGIWALGRNNDKIIEKLNTRVEKRYDAFANSLHQLETRLEAAVDSTEHNVGEGMTAIRQKMTDMELWNRDNFVSRGTFNMVVTQIRESWLRFEDKLDKRLDRIDAKLEDRDGPRHGL